MPKGFVFHIKAFSLFCAQSVPLNALPRVVKDLPQMAPLFQPAGTAPPAFAGGAAGAGSGGRVSATRMGPVALQATWDRFNLACMEASQVSLSSRKPDYRLSLIFRNVAHFLWARLL